MHTDKPLTLPIRDYIIRRLSPTLRISEDVINSVISHQYSSASAATRIHNQVEISGLGKFMFSEKKGNKKLLHYLHLKQAMTNLKETIPEKAEHYQKKLTDLQKSIEYIETKLNVISSQD